MQKYYKKKRNTRRKNIKANSTGGRTLGRSHGRLGEHEGVGAGWTIDGERVPARRGG